jgi:hypothetical protein
MGKKNLKEGIWPIETQMNGEFVQTRNYKINIEVLI